jgi:hypothetical protein
MVADQWSPSDHYTELKKTVDQYDGKFEVGEYPNRWSIPDSYQQAMLKNGLFTYLYRAYRPFLALNNSDYKNAFRYLTDGFRSNTDQYINITHDKKAFARLFEKDKRKVSPPVIEYTEENIYLTAFPNPTNSEVTVLFRVSEDGYYNMAIYNLSGIKIKDVAIDMECKRKIEQSVSIDLSAIPANIYLVKVYSGNNSLGSIKIIKK